VALKNISKNSIANIVIKILWVLTDSLECVYKITNLYSYSFLWCVVLKSKIAFEKKKERNEGSKDSMEFTYFCSLSSVFVAVVLEVSDTVGFISHLQKHIFSNESCPVFICKLKEIVVLGVLLLSLHQVQSFLPWRACW
jgi:hypothetical protein